MARSHAVTNEAAFERYRKIVELDLRGPSYLDGLDAEMRTSPSLVTSAWSARYSRRRYCIEGVSGYADPLADTVGQAALIARNRARDAQVTAAPPWDATALQMVGMTYRTLRAANSLDVGSLMEPHGCGPSVRALWAEAEAHGLAGPEVADYVIAWARRHPASGDPGRPGSAAPTTPSLADCLTRAVGWTPTGNLEQPWGALVDGQPWQVRLNDFPDEPMYGLLVGGDLVGDFHDWPDAWTSSDRPVVERPPVARASAPARARTRRPAVAAGSLLARYQQGEREQVWADLLSLGPEVRDRRYLADAQAVARETMRRARHNVELIVARLRTLDYQFWDPGPQTQQKLRTVDSLMSALGAVGFDFGNARDLMERLTGVAAQGASQPREVFTPPERQIKRRLDGLERAGCVLPLSLRAWMEEVGQIDLTGSHPTLCFMEGLPGFTGVYADPLMIYADVDHLEETFEQWREEEPEDELCPLDISFDAAGKAGLAIDAQVDDCYTIMAPDPAADALLHGEAHETTFVDYLRICFRWGGFPGWDRQPGAPTREIAILTEGLLDI